MRPTSLCSLVISTVFIVAIDGCTWKPMTHLESLGSILGCGIDIFIFFSHDNKNYIKNHTVAIMAGMSCHSNQKTD